MLLTICMAVILQHLAVKKEEEGENINTQAPQIKTIDELKAMNVKQLREEAAARGISVDHTKKELLEILSADVGNDQGNQILIFYHYFA